MKTNDEIKEIVNKARELVKEIYDNDERLKKPENQTPNSEVVNEMNIVFKAILKYMLNN